MSSKPPARDRVRRSRANAAAGAVGAGGAAGLIDPFTGEGVGGSKVAFGTEERPVALSSKTFYNNVRKTVTMGTQGVEFLRSVRAQWMRAPRPPPRRRSRKRPRRPNC